MDPVQTGETAAWQRELARSIRDPAELASALGLTSGELAGAAVGAAQFRVFVPRPYLAKISPGDPADPLLLQVWPAPEEGDEVPGFVTDPLAEAHATRAPGLLHKYQGRALLVTTGVCAVHCRYCFRRHFPYREGAMDQALSVIEADPSIEEVLLSGGDPWTMAPARHQRLVTRLDAIPHVRRLRWHTRLPIVLPSRVDGELCELLAGLRTRAFVVVHANHAAEIDAEVAAAFDRLRATGATLLNQSVLLRGVNDSVEALTDLSRSLIDAGVLPYYLHHLDRVAGAHHFSVPEAEGRALVEALREKLPGYAIPRFVREDPGAY